MKWNKIKVNIIPMGNTVGWKPATLLYAAKLCANCLPWLILARK